MNKVDEIIAAINDESPERPGIRAGSTIVTAEKKFHVQHGQAWVDERNAHHNAARKAAEENPPAGSYARTVDLELAGRWPDDADGMRQQEEVRQRLAGADGRVTIGSIMGFMKRSGR